MLRRMHHLAADDGQFGRDAEQVDTVDVENRSTEYGEISEHAWCQSATALFVEREPGAIGRVCSECFA